MKQRSWVLSVILFSFFAKTENSLAHSFDTPMAYSPFSVSIDRLEANCKKLAEKTAMETKKALIRWQHAQELLGKSYRKSVVKSGESISDVDELLLKWVKKSLRAPWKSSALKITQTITKESEKYGFDPIFVMSVIQSESSFRPEVIGSIGEVGLMQLTPETAKWISERNSIPWKGKNSLKDPVVNIRIGTAYLAYLREEVGAHSQLYVAAYNMGLGNVFKALERRIVPKEYPIRVMHHYLKYYSELKKAVETAVN